MDVRERRVWLLGALRFVALVFALGENTPVYPALRKFIPAARFMTYPVKYVTLVAFLAPLLAAFALITPATIAERGLFAVRRWS